MPKMGNYCKAYPLTQLREFGGWSERSGDLKTSQSSEEDAPDHRYLFLQENLTVTEGVFLDESIVFDQVTREWENFCRNQLKFEIPDFDQEHNEILQRKITE